MAQKKPRASGRVSLYLTPELHEELKALAAALGVDLNGLIGLMIRRSLGFFHMEAQVLAQEKRWSREALESWRQRHPKRAPREFLEDYAREQYVRILRGLRDEHFQYCLSVVEGYRGALVDESAPLPPELRPRHQERSNHE